jgi:hypothetical protein
MIQLSKEMQEPLSMNTSMFDTFSPKRLFQLTSVDARNVQLSIKRLICSTNIITDYQMEEASISFRIISGDLDVSVSEKFSAEMERITKKKTPRKTVVQMIFTEFNRSSGVHISQAFKDLLPYPEPGNVYIGFPTHQTTGCCSHFAARVIPTVCTYIYLYLVKLLNHFNHINTLYYLRWSESQLIS